MANEGALTGALLLRVEDNTLYQIPDELLCQFKMPADHQPDGGEKGTVLQELLDDLPKLINVRNAIRLELSFDPPFNEPYTASKSAKDAPQKLGELRAAIMKATQHGPNSRREREDCPAKEPLWSGLSFVLDD